MTDSESKLNNSDKVNNILLGMNQQEIEEFVCKVIEGLIKSGDLENLLKSESFSKLLKSEIFQNLLKSESFSKLLKSEIFQNLLSLESFKSLLKSDELKNLSDKLKKLVESNKDSKHGFSQPEENDINTENIVAVNLFPSIAGIAVALLVTFLLGYNKNDD